MYKNMIRKLLIFISFAFSCFIISNKIEASYMYCDNKIYGTEFYDCGDKVYTYYEDISHSGIIKSRTKDASILYVGSNDGVEIFYANGYNFFNYSYDDRSDSNNNLWAKITTRGEVIFDGSFDDSWLVDESNSGTIRKIYNDVTNIRQYVNDGEVYRIMAIYFIPGGFIDIGNVTYDGVVVNEGENEVLVSKEGINIDVVSLYGVKEAVVKINGKVVDSSIYENKITVSSSVINNSLLEGEKTKIEVTIKDYFGTVLKKEYSFKLLNNSASIKFETMTSNVVSSSRRIVVNAIAGKGKTLDKDYCWYYWSTSPDDSLSYEEFLKNYANSEYKGSYSEDKGVILRNTTGVFYLYALAKDEDSVIILRSDGYTLDDEGYKVNYKIYDYILVLTLLIVAIIPISIYLFIRKRENRCR